MPITINGDLVLDERAGLQNASNVNDSDDDDLSWSSFQSALSSTLYNHLFTAGGLNLATNVGDANAFPQVAWQNGLISLSDPVNDLQLVKNSSGDAFDGVDSGWQDLAGNHIFLYADSSNNVVLGRVGTGATANPSGAVDLVLVLDEHLAGGKVTSADLYMVQFTALKEPNVNQVDDADVLDLTNKVYLASYASNTVAFNDFSHVPSGSDNWTIIQPSSGGTDPDILVTAINTADTVEVSTQGLGEGSQALNQFEGLRFDMVNGGAGGAGPSPDPLTNPEVHDDSKIAYTAHQLGSGGGFTITQVNPGSSSTTVSVKIAAFDAAGDYQGTAFKTNIASQTAVNITTGSLVVHDAAHNLVTNLAAAGITVDYTGDTLVVNGLKNGFHVDFGSDSSIDRFTVQNITSQSNRSFDLGDIRFTVTTTNNGNNEIGSHIKTEDDGPTITAVTNTGASVVHDETPGQQTDTDSLGADTAFGSTTFDDLFASVPSPGDDLDVAGTGAIGYAASAASLVTVTGGDAGADGPASQELSYALQVTDGTDSGLTTTEGVKIFLFNGTGSATGLVLGRIGADAGAAATGTTAFALTTDTASGKVYLAQYLSLHHPNTGSADEQINLATGSVFMSVTRTDKDGDTATDSNNDISLRVGFQDDGPTITAVTNTSTSVVHDETPGLQTDTDSLGTDTAFGTTTFDSLFVSVPSPGDDLDVAGTGPIGYAASSAGLVTVTGGDAGADGPASTELSYALSVTNGTDSGVTTTEGVKIFLFNGTGSAAGLVLGRVGADAGTAATGTTAFALATDPATGKVYLAQYLSLHHPDTGSADEQINLASGSVFMAVTRTDKDGDTATDSNNDISLQVGFQDDGPTITAATNGAASVVHDETPGQQTDTDSLGTDIAYGATTIASLFTNVSSPGDDLDVTGTGPIGYAASSTGLVTVTGGSAGADGPASQELSYALQVTDGTDSGLTTTEGVKIFLFNGTNSSSGLVIGRIGADANTAASGTAAFALAADPSSGKVFLAQYLSLHHPNTGSADEQINLATGSVFMSVTRTDKDGDTATDSNNDISLQIGFQDDGPTITAVTNTSTSVVHDETPGQQTDTDSLGTDIAYGATTIADLFTSVPSPGDDLDVTGTGPIGYAASSAGLVTVTGGSAGADGPAAQELSYALSVTDGTDSGVTTTEGVKIFLFNGTGSAAGLVLGRVGADAGTAATGATAFALATDPATGKVYLAQYLSLHHNDTGSADEQINLATGSVFMSVTRTDKDGDTATDSNNDISLQVGFQDDGPTITAVTNTGASVVHDETPGQQTDTDSLGTDIAFGATTIASLFTSVPSPGDDLDVTGTGPIGYAASSAGLVTVTGGSAGADGPAAQELSYALSVTNGTDSGLTTTAGTKIFLFNGTGSAAGLVLGRVGADAGTAATGTTAFALTTDTASGKVFLAQYLSLHHSDTNSQDEQVNLASGSLFMSVTRTDKDGDTATDSNNDISLQVGFQDDGPSISTSLAGGHVAFAKNAFLTESTGASPGADGGVVTIDAASIVLPTGFSDTLSLDGQHLTIKDASNVAIYQLDVTATDYTFKVLQDAPPAFVPLDFSAIPSGSPQETLTVPAVGTGTSITFDGVDFVGTGAIGSTLTGHFTNPGAASTVDDLNPNSVGFGEKGGQASQMNQNEGFFADPVTGQIQGLSFDIAGVGGVPSVEVEWWGVSGGAVVYHGLDNDTLPSGSGTTHEEISLAGPVDQIYVRFFYDTNAANSGVRVENFATELPNVIPDRQVKFSLDLTDGDSDVVHSNLVTMFIDA